MTKRKFITYLYLPLVLIDFLLSKIFRFIPCLNLKYNILSARIDLDNSISEDRNKHIPVKLKLKDIKNKKVRYSLFLTGLFKKWNVYYMYNIGVRDFNISDNNRDVIYITKDIIKENDIIHGERLSEWKINKKYSDKNSKRFFRSINLKHGEFYKIEPQMYIISAVDTFRHVEMKYERTIRYEKKKYNELTKYVKKSIKDDDLFHRFNMVGNFNRYPIFHVVVQNDRIDLANLLLNACYDLEEKQRLVTFEVEQESYTKQFVKPIDLVKSDEMKELIEKWTDIEKFERYQKIMKIKKRIK